MVKRVIHQGTYSDWIVMFICSVQEMKVITEKIRDDEESSSTEADWKFAAMVIDRLCLIIYTIFTILATVAVLYTAPHVIVA